MSENNSDNNSVQPPQEAVFLGEPESGGKDNKEDKPSLSKDGGGKKEENRTEIKLASEFDFTTGHKPEVHKKNKAPRPGGFQPSFGRKEHKAPGMPDISMLKKRDDSAGKNFDKDYCPPSDPDEISQDIHISPNTVKLVGALLAILLTAVIGLILYRSMAHDTADTGREYTAVFVSGKNLKVNLSASEWATLSKGSEVKPNSLVMTSDSPDNVLNLPNGATLRADSNTHFKLDNITSDKDGNVTAAVSLAKGRLFAVDAPKTNIVIDTKYCKITPVGTRYCVAQEEHSNLTEETVIFVFDGSVKVTHKADSAAAALVNANNKTVVKESTIQKPALIGKHKSNWLSWNLSWQNPAEMEAAAKKNKVDKKAKKSNPNVQTYNPAGDTNMRANAPDHFTQRSSSDRGGSGPDAASPPPPNSAAPDPYHDHVVVPADGSNERPQSRPAHHPQPQQYQQSNPQPQTYNPGDINNNGMPNAPGAMDSSQFNSVVNNYDMYDNQQNNYNPPPPNGGYNNPPPPNGGYNNPPPPNGGGYNPPPQGDNRGDGSGGPGPNNPPPPPPSGMHFDPNTGMVSPSYDPSQATPLNDKDLLHSVTDEKNNRNLLKATTTNDDVLKASHYK